MSKLQEHFDKSTRGIIAQGGPATSESGGCFYHIERDGKKLRCGIGQLIPAGKEPPASEIGFNLVTALETFLPMDEVGLVRDTYSDLQSCHDNAASAVDVNNGLRVRPLNEFWVCFKAELHQFAMVHNLNEDVLKEIPIGQTA